MSSEKIIQSKYHQSNIENAFKISKDHTLGGWWPIYDWTDQKLTVHGFCCYLSLLLLSTLEYCLNQFDLKMSAGSLINNYMNSVYKIKQEFINKKGKKLSSASLSKLDAVQTEVIRKFNLKKYLS